MISWPVKHKYIVEIEELYVTIYTFIIENTVGYIDKPNRSNFVGLTLINMLTDYVYEFSYYNNDYKELLLKDDLNISSHIKLIPEHIEELGLFENDCVKYRFEELNDEEIFFINRILVSYFQNTINKIIYNNTSAVYSVYVTSKSITILEFEDVRTMRYIINQSIAGISVESTDMVSDYQPYISK